MVFPYLHQWGVWVSHHIQSCTHHFNTIWKHTPCETRKQKHSDVRCRWTKEHFVPFLCSIHAVWYTCYSKEQIQREEKIQPGDFHAEYLSEKFKRWQRFCWNTFKQGLVYVLTNAGLSSCLIDWITCAAFACVFVLFFLCWTLFASNIKRSFLPDVDVKADLCAMAGRFGRQMSRCCLCAIVVISISDHTDIRMDAAENLCLLNRFEQTQIRQGALDFVQGCTLILTLFKPAFICGSVAITILL